jgi:hypothetical protein
VQVVVGLDGVNSAAAAGGRPGAGFGRVSRARERYAAALREARPAPVAGVRPAGERALRTDEATWCPAAPCPGRLVHRS